MPLEAVNLWRIYERRHRFGETAMLRTITVGDYVSVQGTFVQMLKNGLMQVRVGRRVFTGRPVGA
jgi:hypothetical protein